MKRVSSNASKTLCNFLVPSQFCLKDPYYLLFGFTEILKKKPEIKYFILLKKANAFSVA